MTYIGYYNLKYKKSFNKNVTLSAENSSTKSDEKNAW